MRFCLPLHAPSPHPREGKYVVVLGTFLTHKCLFEGAWDRAREEGISLTVFNSDLNRGVLSSMASSKLRNASGLLHHVWCWAMGAGS